MAYAKQQHPYKPRHHLEWLRLLLAHSDATAQRAGLRAAILQARKERAQRFQVVPMPQIFEVAPDGTVTEVDAPDDRPDTAERVKRGFLIGALAALPFVVPLVTRELTGTSRRKRSRRR